MKKSRLYLLLALVAVAGFALGLCFDNLFTKSHAEELNTEAALPNENAFEVMSTGMTSSASYEIINVYGRKYIIFSSGGDIEVLNY